MVMKCFLPYMIKWWKFGIIIIVQSFIGRAENFQRTLFSHKIKKENVTQYIYLESFVSLFHTRTIFFYLFFYIQIYFVCLF